MNRIYKVIWSKVKNCYVVTSELAKSHTKGCSGKRVGRLLAVGAVVAGLMLPMGDAEAISTSYVPSYNSQYGSSGPADYQTDGGHIDVGQIGGYNQQTGSYYNYVYVNNDGTVEFFKNENYQHNDISSLVGNVAVGNFSQAGSAADANMVNFYNSSFSLAYETKPETGNWYSTTAPNGKQYWYASSYSYRTYAYSPTYNYGGSVIEKDGKYYHQIQNFEPELDDQGNWQYDSNGNPIGKTVLKFAEIGEKIWKQNSDNPSGNLLVDYKKVDEYGHPVFDLTAEDIGLDESNPYGYSGGTNNVAVGNKSKTLSHSSVAVGDTSTARGYRSVAIGAEAEAGQENAGGDWNNGTSAVAIGDSAKAYGGTSVAVGSHAQTYSFSGVAVGNNSNASTEYAIAIGDNARVAYVNGADDDETKKIAVHGIAIGRDTLVEGKDGTAVGRQSQALMRNATAYGNNAHADAFNSVAIGNKAIAGSQEDTSLGQSAVAVGNRATALDEYTTAIGASTFAKGTHSVAVGDSNRALGKYSTAVGAGWSRYKVDEDDNDNTEAERAYESIGANQATGDYSTAVGHANAATGDNSVAMGMQNAVSGNNSIGIGTKNIVGSVTKPGDTKELTEKTEKGDVTGFAFGNENEITGNNSIAIGVGNKVSGENSGAIGDPNIVDGKESYVVGNNSTVDSDANESFIMGNSSTASAKRGLIFGNESKVSGEGGIVAGSKSEVSAADSIAIGNNAKATLKNSVALGSGSETTHMGGLDGKKEIEIPGTNTKYTNVTGESPVGTVSVGKPGEERTITNVAAGRVGPGSTDAINGSELYAVEQQVVANSADIVNLSNRIDKVGAGAAALAGLHPLDFDPDEKWHVAAGVGNYGSETAVAIGAFYQPTDDILYNIATTVGDGRNMVSGGVSIRFGQKSHQSRSKKAMAKEIIELREEVAELKALVYDLTGKGGLDPSKTAVFPDTPENHWAYDYVAVLAGNGVLEGYQDGYFKGNRQLTRYEMAAIIYRLMSKGIEVDSRMLQEFAPELARVKVDTLTHYGDGTPHIQRVRIIPQRG
jgi:hypothetical protein